MENTATATIAQPDAGLTAPDMRSYDERVADESYRLSLMTALVCFLAGIFAPISLVQRLVFVIFLIANPDDIETAAKFSFLGRSTAYGLRGQLYTLSSPDDVGAILQSKKGRGPYSPLVSIEGKILGLLESNNFHTLQEIREAIKGKFNVTCNLKTLSSFLKAHGYKKQKCGSIPSKADVAAQKEFYFKTLFPLMERARQGKALLFFVDASHFVFGSDFLGSVYSKTRRFTKTSSGRKRYNVLGALNWVTKQIVTVCNKGYVNAKTVMALLDKIRKENPGKEIHIVLDNANYQHCKAVMEHMESLSINWHFLPTYSPNLNLIERAWGFVKRELRKNVYTDFAAFCEEIDRIIDSTATTNKGKFDSLIGEKAAVR